MSAAEINKPRPPICDTVPEPMRVAVTFHCCPPSKLHSLVPSSDSTNVHEKLRCWLHYAFPSTAYQPLVSTIGSLSLFASLLCVDRISCRNLLVVRRDGVLPVIQVELES